MRSLWGRRAAVFWTAGIVLFVWALTDIVVAVTRTHPSQAAYRAILMGDSESSVENAMGPPDSVVPGPSGPGERCLHWAATAGFISLDAEDGWVVCFLDGRVDRKG